MTPQQFRNQNKLLTVIEIATLSKRYMQLVNDLGSILVSSEMKNKIDEEVVEIEKSLSNKLAISRQLRGF